MPIYYRGKAMSADEFSSARRSENSAALAKIRVGSRVRAVDLLGEDGEIMPGDLGVITSISGGSVRVRWDGGGSSSENASSVAPSGGASSRPTPNQYGRGVTRVRGSSSSGGSYCSKCRGPHVFKHGRP